MTEDSPEARFKECFERLQNEFSTYDQTVDVVSCLELFFEEGLREEVDHFDRFPRFTDPELTPDATVIFRH